MINAFLTIKVLNIFSKDPFFYIYITYISGGLSFRTKIVSEHIFFSSPIYTLFLLSYFPLRQTLNI